MLHYAQPEWKETSGEPQAVSRRSHRRLKCAGPAQIRVYPEGETATASLVDLSLHGCCVQLSAPLQVGAYPHVEVLFSVKGSTLQLAGVIRHREEDLRAGIEFTHVSHRKMAEIRAVVVDLFETQTAQRLRSHQARSC